MNDFGHMPLLGALGAGESQPGAPWTGSVAPGEGPIPSGGTWAPAEGASINVEAGSGPNVRRKGQTLMPGWASGGLGWKPLLIGAGILALGGLAFWAYKKYGHRVFGGGKKRTGRNRPRPRRRSRRG